MPRFLSLAPRLAAYFFFAAATTFFVLNPAAFQKLGIINVLQFNLQGVNYAFVMALFAYTLPGVLLTSYYGWQLTQRPAQFRVESALLLVAGTLLVQLGAISTAPEFPGRTLYLMVLTWLFPTLHGAAWGWKALTGRANERRQRLTHAVMGLYLFCLVPGSIFFGADEIDEKHVTLSIAVCFAWYASRRFVYAQPTPVLPEVGTAPDSI